MLWMTYINLMCLPSHHSMSLLLHPGCLCHLSLDCAFFCICSPQHFHWPPSASLCMCVCRCVVCVCVVCCTQHTHTHCVCVCMCVLCVSECVVCKSVCCVNMCVMCIVCARALGVCMCCVRVQVRSIMVCCGIHATLVTDNKYCLYLRSHMLLCIQWHWAIPIWQRLAWHAGSNHNHYDSPGVSESPRTVHPFDCSWWCWQDALAEGGFATCIWYDAFTSIVPSVALHVVEVVIWTVKHLPWPASVQLPCAVRTFSSVTSSRTRAKIIQQHCFKRHLIIWKHILRLFGVYAQCSIACVPPSQTLCPRQWIHYNALH